MTQEDYRLLAGAINQLADNRFDLKANRAASAGLASDGAETCSDYAEQGWFALGISEANGGLGGGLRALSLVMKAVGRSLLLEPVLPSLLAGRLIERVGSPEQCAQLLPALSAGSVRIGVAHSEASASFGQASRCEVRSGRMSGQKTGVLHADRLDQLIVSARDADGKSIGLYLVNAASSDVTRVLYRLMDGRWAGDFEFDHVAAVRLGTADASDAIDEMGIVGAALVAAEAVGAISALQAASVEYAKVRRQFGTAIGSFQVLQHRLVDMLILERETSAMVDHSAAAFDAGDADARRLVSATKVRADKAGRYIGEMAIQIHGGMGMTDETPVGHYLKRLLVIASQFGSINTHLDVLNATRGSGT